MAARLTWILAALALGLVALGSVLWRGDARFAPAERGAATQVATPGSDAALREVHAARPTAAPVAARAPAPAAPLVFGGDVLPDVGAPTVEGVIVRGRVSGPGVDPERVELELRRVGWNPHHPVLGACDADGRYELDAADLLDRGMMRMQATVLELVVRHPDCLHERRKISLQRAVTPEHGYGMQFVQWREGTTVCEVDVELRPAGMVRVTLAGVEDPLDFAVVAAELDNGRPVHPWVAHGTPHPRLGVFHLRLAPGASYLVVAAAREQRPTAARIDLNAPGPRELVLHPERGAELSGRLSVAPGFAAPELGVELQFALDEGAEPPEIWPRPASTFDDLVWLDGAFEWRLRSQRTHDGGRFAFRGLAPRAYELRALGVGVPGEELRAWPVARLSAPAAGLSLGPVLASLELDLGPTTDGPLRFELADAEQRNALRIGPYRTDAEGRALVHLPPGHTYGVFVDGVEVGRVDTPAAGASARFALAR